MEFFVIPGPSQSSIGARYDTEEEMILGAALQAMSSAELRSLTRALDEVMDTGDPQELEFVYSDFLLDCDESAVRLSMPGQGKRAQYPIMQIFQTLSEYLQLREFLE